MLKKAKEYLYGSSVIIPALEQRKRRLFELFINEQSNNEYIHKATNLAQQSYIPITPLPSAKLDKLSEGRPNQGMVLQAGPLMIPSVQYVDHLNQKVLFNTLDGPIHHTYHHQHPFLVVLDRIMDPQNVGAIIRTAYFHGVDGIIKTTRDTSPLTPSVSKASAGALEMMNLFDTANLGTFLKKSSENGWCIYGTALGADNVLELSPGYRPSLFHGPTILVVANEGSGMRLSHSSLCDVHLKVPGYDHKEQVYHVDSLNVSVATGILIHRILDSQ